MTKRKKNPNKNAIAAKHKLTPKEEQYVLNKTDPDSPTYLNGRQSALKAYDCKDINSADSISYDVGKRPRVRKALQEILGTRDIDNLLVEGIYERLEDPSSRHWQPTADYVAKIRGLFAPEKQIQVTLTPEDRDRKYDEILKLIGGDDPKVEDKS